MSARRLVFTSAAMAVAAAVLGELTPALSDTTSSLLHAQRTVDTRGADALLLCAAALATWAVWAWGMVGLALTAASAIPGVGGAIAGWLLRAVLPASARRGAALALGIGLGIAGPVAPGAQVGHRLDLAVATTPAAVPDWPHDDGGGAPDWPAAGQSEDRHVVVRGDCLWNIAAAWLARSGPPPTDAAIARAVQAWWSVNERVIGSDPDLILPGQVLRAPQP